MKKCILTVIIPADELFTIGKFVEDHGGVVDDYSQCTNSKGTKKTRGPKQFRTDERDAEIRKYHKEHPNVKAMAIAKKFGHGQSTISNILRG